jgi:polynucleotide 5'-kinase involved in rRNA processing
MENKSNKLISESASDSPAIIRQNKQHSKQIDQYLKNEKLKFERLQHEPKLLILGSSDSGKSTLLKQLKILYGNGFTKQEVEEAKNLIWSCIARACSVLTAEEPFKSVIIL